MKPIIKIPEFKMRGQTINIKRVCKERIYSGVGFIFRLFIHFNKISIKRAP